MSRNVNLDLIKCIACIAVVGLHAVGMHDYSIYYLCGCGVPLFFMVNGYLMFSKETITYSYILHKILQIVKIVFAFNLLITLPVLAFRHKFVNPFTLSLNSLFQKGYLWHFWFFGALLLIYLILPPLHRLLRFRIRLHIATTIICLFICLFMSILSLKKGYPLHAYIPQSLRIWTWLFYFTAGGLLSKLLPKLAAFPLLLHAILLIIFSFINNKSLKYIGLFVTQSRIADYYYDYFTSIVYYCFLFTLLMRIPICNIGKKGIIFASSLTTGIFILHPILLTGIQSYYTPAGHLTVLVFWFALTLLSAFISFVMSKLPFFKELIRLS